MKKVKIYKRFNRFWHWSQAALIIMLGITGLEIHGSLTLFGFGQAVELHRWMAYTLIGLVAFAIFWHFTTGEWRHYLPQFGSLEGYRAMLRYYTGGIFRNEAHPYKKSELSKLNPLQRTTYLALKLVIIPVQVITGLLYLYYNSWAEFGLTTQLEVVALVHTLFSWLLVAFLVLHVYMTTTGHTLFSNIKAMITGWEDLEEDETEAAP